MLDSNEISKIGESHILNHLKKQGYTIGNCETESFFSSFIEAEKLNKKFIFLVNTCAFTDPEDAAKYTYDVVHEERKDLLARATQAGAVGMVAIIKINAEAGKEGELLEPISFKMM